MVKTVMQLQILEVLKHQIAGIFRWDNSTPVGSNGRGYHAWVQSGDAYPNASNYIDVLIRNGGFYRITLKRSHSSAEASVCHMMIYGLANNTNAQYPVVHMTGASGGGTNHSTVQSGGGRGSSNAVIKFLLRRYIHIMLTLMILLLGLQPLVIITKVS